MSVVERSQDLLNLLPTITANSFEAIALQLYKHQAVHCAVFRQYHELLQKDAQKAANLSQLVYLPIQFFKNFEVKTGEWHTNTQYHSSGTTGSATSKHFVYNTQSYLEHAATSFKQQYGPMSNYHLLALVPSYLENPHSSLIAMLAHFVEKTESDFSGFFANNYEQLLATLQKLAQTNDSKKIILWGVTYALLDILETNTNFSGLKDRLVIVETGGMKGRRAELQKTELHKILCEGFGVNEIHSEYGMTELLSQAYSQGQNVFVPSASMHIQLREVSDPFTFIDHDKTGKTGAINIIDLANAHSCAFIETADLGQYVGTNGQFSILGRLDNADIRGCNLLVS
jgi:hypothetical protein